MKTKLFSITQLTFLAVSIGLTALAVTGCHLSQPGSASFASVIVAGRSVQEIQQAAVVVFQQEGYTALRGPDNTLIFEREGSRANNLSQNGLVGTHYGAQTVIRVRTKIVDLGGGSLRLQCQAFMVRDAGDSFFEDEHALANVRARPYQKLLDEVALRLK